MLSFLGGCRFWCFSVKTFRVSFIAPRMARSWACAGSDEYLLLLHLFFPVGWTSSSSSFSCSSSSCSCSLSSRLSSPSPSSSEVVESSDEWKKVSEGFQTTAKFPNCLGALDGKHIRIRPPPPHCGAQFFNYKHFNSIVMMALVDSNYRFLYVDVGCNGRVSDGGVFRGSTLQESLEQRTANIPQPTPLPGTDMSMPFFVVADEAFPLKSYLMKPFARRGLSREQRVFNYRLSRARRIVENTFSVFANRFKTWRQDPPLQQAALPRSTNASSEAKQNRERLIECPIQFHTFTTLRFLSLLLAATRPCPIVVSNLLDFSCTCYKSRDLQH
uniref:DDE Tnp4 domain-containing protein n=1 Tax=Sinocyclocheilus rhinocerous TaxID=307959 RepID=A0A673L854_9TELE